MANKNQLIMDNCLRLTAFDPATGMAVFMLSEVEDFNTAVEVANTREITDHNGTTVAILEAGKKATMSGNASFINFGLLAAQAGSEVQRATADAPIVTPRYEAIYASDAVDGAITLEKTPVGEAGNEIKYLYVLNEDGTINSDLVYEQAAAASDTEFAVEGSKLTLPTNVDANAAFAVFYDFEGTGTILIENNDGEFGKVYIVKADILCRDICNQNIQTVVTVESKNAKLESAYDLTWTSESKHPFSFSISKDFCSKSGKLMTTYVIED